MDKVITPDSAKEINQLLKLIGAPSEREMLLELITDGICINCGDVVDGICHCENDE